MSERVNVQLADVRAVGRDWRVMAKVSEKYD